MGNTLCCANSTDMEALYTKPGQKNSKEESYPGF